MSSIKPLHCRIEVISDEVAAVLRLKTGAERLEIASRMFGGASRMLANHLRHLHPEWNGRQIDQEAAKRLSHGSV